MNKWVKRTSIALGALAMLGVAATVVGKALGERKMARNVVLQVRALDVVPGPARIEQGRYLYNTRGCAECHGGDGAGKAIIQDGGMRVVAPNITAGPNGTTVNYKVVDWVRTVRHGVKPNGNPVMIMPSEDYSRFTDEDMSALVSFLQQMPPVSGNKALIDVPAQVKALYAFGMIQDASEKIDHAQAPARLVAAAVTPEFGAYVANGCIGCHGATLSGGRIPGTYPTPELFIAMLRSGQRPDGKAISTVMPFGSLKQMNDTDVRALYAYLKTVAPLEAGRH
jgi:cytochrome c553